MVEMLFIITGRCHSVDSSMFSHRHLRVILFSRMALQFNLRQMTCLLACLLVVGLSFVKSEYSWKTQVLYQSTNLNFWSVWQLAIVSVETLFKTRKNLVCFVGGMANPSGRMQSGIKTRPTLPPVGKTRETRKKLAVFKHPCRAQRMSLSVVCGLHAYCCT